MDPEAIVSAWSAIPAPTFFPCALCDANEESRASILDTIICTRIVRAAHSAGPARCRSAWPSRDMRSHSQAPLQAIRVRKVLGGPIKIP
jgi:hypothetical protein